MGGEEGGKEKGREGRREGGEENRYDIKQSLNELFMTVATPTLEQRDLHWDTVLRHARTVPGNTGVRATVCQGAVKDL